MSPMSDSRASLLSVGSSLKTDNGRLSHIADPDTTSCLLDRKCSYSEVTSRVAGACRNIYISHGKLYFAGLTKNPAEKDQKQEKTKSKKLPAVSCPGIFKIKRNPLIKIIKVFWGFSNFF